MPDHTITMCWCILPCAAHWHRPTTTTTTHTCACMHACSNVCVFLAPWMAANTAMVAYVLAKEVVTGPRLTPEQRAVAARNRRRAESAGLLAALFTAVVPGYIARSAAGSFDNEGVAIFALLATYALWVRAVHTGSAAWAGATAFAYLYMASAWGGYVFIINLLPLHVLVLMLAGMYSHR